jgi:hypothetical protein
MAEYAISTTPEIRIFLQILGESNVGCNGSNGCVHITGRLPLQLRLKHTPDTRSMGAHPI